MIHQGHMTTRGLFLLGPVIGFAVFGAVNLSSCTGTESDAVVSDPTRSETASLTGATPVPLSVISITSPAEPDSTGRLDAQAAEGAECDLISDTLAVDGNSVPDLGPKVADATGFVTWSWHIDSETQPGVEYLRLTCDGETVSAQIEITAPGFSDGDPGSDG